MRVRAEGGQQQGNGRGGQRRAGLPRRQRAVGRPGGLLKTHEILSARQKRTSQAAPDPFVPAAARLPKTCKCLKNYPKPREIPDVTDITVNRLKSSHSGSRNETRGNVAPWLSTSASTRKPAPAGGATLRSLEYVNKVAGLAPAG